MHAAQCHQALGDPAQGLGAVVKLLQELGAVKGGAASALHGADPALAQGDRELRQEALAALVDLYADVGAPHQASAFFERFVEPEQAAELVSRLADLHLERGQSKAALSLLDALAKSSSNPLDLLEIRIRLQRASTLVGDGGASLSRMEAACATLKRADLASGVDRQRLDKLRGELELEVFAQSSALYAESHGPESIDRVVRMLALHLDAFPESDRRSQVAFTLAQALERLGRQREALPLYLDVIELDPSGEQGALSRARVEALSKH